jgi:hypothetical protein
MVTIQIASIPEREKTLKQAIESLNGWERMNVILNNYDRTPIWLKDMPGVFVYHHDNKHEDGSKFLNAQFNSDYVVVCDDDIKYPYDFVSRMKHVLENRFRNQVILTVMGKRLKPRPIKSYYKDELVCYKTFDELQDHQEVEVPGTCGMIYHTRFCRPGIANMFVPNADVCMAKYAKEHHLKCFVINKKPEWLVNLMPQVPDSPSIFDKYKENDGVITEFVNKYL